TRLQGDWSSDVCSSDLTAVACGYYHSLALKMDGTVVGFGKNDNGESTPPASLSNVVAIAADYGYSVALKADGTVVGWGFDYYNRSEERRVGKDARPWRL